jgi:hypothetical protein
MLHPHIAPFLPAEVWQALQTVTRYTDTLPISEHETRRIHHSIETLAEKFVLISQFHNLSYPTGG